MGYVLTQILGGYLDQWFGGKWVRVLFLYISYQVIYFFSHKVLGISALGSGLISLIIPAVAKINPGNAWPVFAARLLEGAFQGPLLPVVYSMAAKWVPRTEKSFLIGIISAGGQLGPVTGMLLSGFLTSAFGWEVVFYCLGSAIVVWFAGFVFLVYSTPSDHPRISQVCFN